MKDVYHKVWSQLRVTAATSGNRSHASGARKTRYLVQILRSYKLPFAINGCAPELVVKYSESIITKKGMGETHPVENETANGRNRRAEIVLKH